MNDPRYEPDDQVCPLCGETLVIEYCGYPPNEWEEVMCPNFDCNYTNSTEPDFESLNEE